MGFSAFKDTQEKSPISINQIKSKILLQYEKTFINAYPVLHDGTGSKCTDTTVSKSEIES